MRLLLHPLDCVQYTRQFFFYKVSGGTTFPSFSFVYLASSSSSIYYILKIEVISIESSIGPNHGHFTHLFFSKSGKEKGVKQYFSFGRENSLNNKRTELLLLLFEKECDATAGAYITDGISSHYASLAMQMAGVVIFTVVEKRTKPSHRYPFTLLTSRRAIFVFLKKEEEKAISSGYDWRRLLTRHDV